MAALAALRKGGLRWHLVGHLQANKARPPSHCSTASTPWTTCGWETAGKGGRGAEKPLPVLVQVKLGDEDTKAGLDEQHLFPALEICAGSQAAAPRRPHDPAPLLRGPGDRASLLPPPAGAPGQGERGRLLLGSELSMGMSHDFEVAIPWPRGF